MAETYFDVLGLPPTSDFGMIASAYQRKKVECKSDPARLRLLEEAYRVLMNPMSLRKYLEDLKPVEAPRAGVGEDLIVPGSLKVVKMGPQRDGPMIPSRRRQMTEILEVAGEIPPKPAPSATLNRKSGRQRTQFFEPGAEEKPLEGQAEPANVTVTNQKRQRTQIGETPLPPQADQPVSRPALEKRLRTTPIEIKSERKEKGSSASISYTYAGETNKFSLKEGENVIGRPPLSGTPPDVPLLDAERYISRRHAVILVEGSKCLLKDMGSDNGSYLNGERLQPAILYPLKDGDVIEIEMRQLKLSISDS